MSPDLVVIGGVILQNATQLRFVEHDEMVERFATDRSDEALDVAVLPITATAVRLDDLGCAVAVANQVTRRFVPGKGIGHLARDPLGGRIGS